MRGTNSEECHAWRQYLKNNYSSEFEFLDPTRANISDSEAIKVSAKIVAQDKQDIARSDAIICHIWRYSCGSCQEELIGFTTGKIVVGTTALYCNVPEEIMRENIGWQ